MLHSKRYSGFFFPPCRTPGIPASGGGLDNVHLTMGQGASSACHLDNGRSAQDSSPSVVFIVPPVQQSVHCIFMPEFTRWENSPMQGRVITGSRQSALNWGEVWATLILHLALAQRPGGNLLGCLCVSLCCACPCTHVDGPGWAVAFIHGRGQKLPLSL